jgi:hypothetical protein
MLIFYDIEQGGYSNGEYFYSGLSSLIIQLNIDKIF